MMPQRTWSAILAATALLTAVFFGVTPVLSSHTPQAKLHIDAKTDIGKLPIILDLTGTTRVTEHTVHFRDVSGIAKVGVGDALDTFQVVQGRGEVMSDNTFTVTAKIRDQGSEGELKLQGTINSNGEVSVKGRLKIQGRGPGVASSVTRIAPPNAITTMSLDATFTGTGTSTGLFHTLQPRPEGTTGFTISAQGENQFLQISGKAVKRDHKLQLRDIEGTLTVGGRTWRVLQAHGKIDLKDGEIEIKLRLRSDQATAKAELEGSVTDISPDKSTGTFDLTLRGELKELKVHVDNDSGSKSHRGDDQRQRDSHEGRGRGSGRDREITLSLKGKINVSTSGS